MHATGHVLMDLELSTGDSCAACGREIVLVRDGADEVVLCCDCGRAAALC